MNSHDSKIPSRADEGAVIGPGHTFATITDQIAAIVLSEKTRRGWWLGFGISFGLCML
ncbi:MAG: hypothetical protein HY537_05580, partial [Deltaproteobacteria bacterium]|nr:hypothetical protein [Deltaproteobacteria bacterium]